MRGTRHLLIVALTLGLLGLGPAAEARRFRAGDAAQKARRGNPRATKRMEAKLRQRARGPAREKPRRTLSISKRQMRRAMSRREMGLRNGETERARKSFGRDRGARRARRARANAGLRFRWDARRTARRR
ncbi:MAG TPA: hypothetical protein VKZ63_13310 [Kofleriaceae bacterium]|nr:hypothetical protein [Kofleriaceae bacterium]